MLAICALVAAAPSRPLRAQEPPAEPSPQPAGQDSQAGPAVTVKGVVLNAATGKPLPRALVTVANSQAFGALTDGDGRFDISGLHPGLQQFLVRKPGFVEDIPDSQPTHRVRAAAGMSDLSFSLAPANALSGRITLSSGLPAVGVGIDLLRRQIASGRAVWLVADHHIATPDGSFRFGGLKDGSYLLRTQPELDNNQPGEPSCEAGIPKALPGYAIQYYRGAASPSAAALIVLSGGQTVQADLALNRIDFHLVRAAILRAPAGAGWNVVTGLADRDGNTISYPLHEEKDHSICAYLPDGSYTLATGASSENEPSDESSPHPNAAPAAQPASSNRIGFLDFSVEGQPVPNLRLALAPATPTPVHLRYQPGPPKPVKPQTTGTEEDEKVKDDTEPLTLSARPVSALLGSDVSEDIVTDSAPSGENTDSMESKPPGSYWLQASTGTQGVCVASVTAGGESMMQKPWIAGGNGAGAPIDVLLRTDCATLTVQMPPTLPAQAAGEGAAFFVYLLPEFDSGQGMEEAQVDQFENRSATIEDIVPGRYRVFTFRAQQWIEFHNPAELDSLGPSRELTLEPGATSTLVLEEAPQ